MTTATKDRISRKEAIDYVKSYIHEIITESGTDKNEHTNNILRMIVDGLNEFTPITPDLSEYSDKLYKLAYERGKAEGLNIPEGTTNGDVIKSIAKREPFIDTFGSPYMVFKKEWWDAPYKQEGKE